MYTGYLGQQLMGYGILRPSLYNGALLYSGICVEGNYLARGGTN